MLYWLATCDMGTVHQYKYKLYVYVANMDNKFKDKIANVFRNCYLNFNLTHSIQKVPRCFYCKITTEMNVCVYE